MNATMAPPQAERTTLYYREGSSDKVYQVGIEPRGEAFVVNFAFGRRGSTLQTGTKTSSPVDYETAKRTYDKLVREKKAKGYSPGADGTPYQHTQAEQRATGILPQLLNPIEEEEAKRLLHDPAYATAGEVRRPACPGQQARRGGSWNQPQGFAHRLARNRIPIR